MTSPRYRCCFCHRFFLLLPSVPVLSMIERCGFVVARCIFRWIARTINYFDACHLGSKTPNTGFKPEHGMFYSYDNYGWTVLPTSPRAQLCRLQSTIVTAVSRTSTSTVQCFVRIALLTPVQYHTGPYHVILAVLAVL